MEIKEDYMMYGVLIIVAATVVFSVVSFLNFQSDNVAEKPAEELKSATEMPDASQMNPQRMSSMSLTEFDIGLAKEFMDKDGDGRCDICGMPVEMCMSSGQLQCNMDPASTIGILGSLHIHADWKMHLGGKPFDFSRFAMDMSKTNTNITSSFIHVDKGAPPPEKTGDVLHMHATGVPLWLFFKSIGVKVPGSVKLFVNGKLNAEGLEYVFKDGDKLLLSDAADQSVIQTQLLSITDHAKIH